MDIVSSLIVPVTYHSTAIHATSHDLEGLVLELLLLSDRCLIATYLNVASVYLFQHVWDSFGYFLQNIL